VCEHGEVKIKQLLARSNVYGLIDTSAKNYLYRTLLAEVAVDSAVRQSRLVCFLLSFVMCTKQ